MDSAAQERQPTVAPMEEFLRETLEETEALLEGLAEDVERVRDEFRGRREHLRARLYALRLADDASFEQEVGRLDSDLSSGHTPTTFSLEVKLEHQG